MILGFQAETFAPSNTELTYVHLLLSYPQPLILSLVYILFPIFLIVKEIHTSWKKINKEIKTPSSKNHHCQQFYVYSSRFFPYI